jgi:epsilon-lactone hydrolase
LLGNSKLPGASQSEQQAFPFATRMQQVATRCNSGQAEASRTATIKEQGSMPKPEFNPPGSISREAAAYFQATFTRAARDRLLYPEPGDRDGWTQFNEAAIAERASYNAALIARYSPWLERRIIAGVPVLDIQPREWRLRDKVIVYTHGGGYVGGSADDALDSTLPLATESGLRIISIGYTLAPHAQFQRVTDETVAVLRGLRAQGVRVQDIAILGDSAGGGLAAATALKFRDTQRELVAAVVLWSPWCDLTGSGDSYATLADEEPFFTYPDHLQKAALAYAGIDQMTNSYASPLFGDFAEGYPPTLIQVGTHELLLSDSVRLYKSLSAAGQAVDLDIYEGMWHVFQFKPIDSPEAQAARRATIEFLLNQFQAADLSRSD